MKNFKILAQMLTLITGLLFFAGCQQDETVSPNSAIDQRYDSPIVSPSTRPTTFYGLGTKNELYTYTTSPLTKQDEVMLNGLQKEETMRSIDIRPATKELYGISDQDRIYRIDPSNGSVKPVSEKSFIPGVDAAVVGFDFDSKEDRIVVMAEDGQALKINPDNGQTEDIDAAVIPSQTGTNSVAHSGSSTTMAEPTLYTVDGSSGKVYRVDSGGNPILVGPTGLKMAGDAGFDITKDGTAMGAFLASGVVPDASGTHDDLSEEDFRVYTIDLKSGSATNLGRVSPMIGMAVKQ